jgi:hypothetical protein
MKKKALPINLEIELESGEIQEIVLKYKGFDELESDSLSTLLEKERLLKDAGKLKELKAIKKELAEAKLEALKDGNSNRDKSRVRDYIISGFEPEPTLDALVEKMDIDMMVSFLEYLRDEIAEAKKK